MKNWMKGAVPYDEFLKKELKDPKLKKAYDDLELEFQIISLMIQRRIDSKMTQQQLAKKLGVKQPVISQFEQGNFNPTVKFLQKLTKALNGRLEIKIYDKN